jgi:hypothetical protein
VLGGARALPAPSLPARTSAWVAPGIGRYVVDDFESDPWPRADQWVAVLDLGSPGQAQIAPAPRDCRAAGGSRSLWSAGGGSQGQTLACGSAAPRNRQTSAVLALDLAAIGRASGAWLTFDVWADAAPAEGLLINTLVFDPAGAAHERRIVYSATGRSVDWSRGVRLDLTRLVDRLDPTWSGDLRGQLAYLEFLFLADGSTPAGQGMFVDNVAVESWSLPPVVVTPQATATSPADTDRTEACTTEPDCRTLRVWAYIDYRCDRRFQYGVDERVTSNPRVEVDAGGEKLGTRLDERGYATSRVRSSGGAIVTLTELLGMSFCANSVHPVVVEPDHFTGSLTRVELRLQRTP